MPYLIFLILAMLVKRASGRVVSMAEFMYGVWNSQDFYSSLPDSRPCPLTPVL